MQHLHTSLWSNPIPPWESRCLPRLASPASPHCHLPPMTRILTEPHLQGCSASFLLCPCPARALSSNLELRCSQNPQSPKGGTVHGLQSWPCWDLAHRAKFLDLITLKRSLPCQGPRVEEMKGKNSWGLVQWCKCFNKDRVLEGSSQTLVSSMVVPKVIKQRITT